MAEKPPIKFVGVNVPTTLSSQLQRIAEREGRSLSSVVRRLLALAIKQQQPERRDDHDAAA